MAIEQVGPGDVSSSYGTRSTIQPRQMESAGELKPDYNEYRQESGTLTAAQVGAAVAALNDRPGRMVGYELEQPADITRPVTRYGKLACRFGSGMWSATTGAPTLTQGHTGWNGSGAKTGITSRTGMPDMLKVVPAANTTEQIRLQTFATNMVTPSLNGKFGLWVYVALQPGYQVGGTPAGTITVELTTNAATMSNGLGVGFNTNQIREGWNFLTFVMRDFEAYQPASGVTEYHPFGVSASGYGSAADANILTTPLARLQISWANMLGAELYFDSIWTDFECQAQMVMGYDGGSNFLTIAKPIMDEFGIVGYCAQPYNTVDSGTSNNTVQADLMSNSFAEALAAYADGWDSINHTVTHPSVGGMSSESAIVYQLEQARAWQIEMGLIRGIEFYASPQSSSSRLSEAVIKGMGFKLQRHARRAWTPITPWGLDNPHHVGGLDIGSAVSGGVATVTGGVSGSVSGWQAFSKCRRAIDIAEAYGQTVHVFWHGVTSTGDTGSGEDATGDNLLVTTSAFRKFCEYAATRRAAGALTICDGYTGFWYGSNA